MTLYNLSPFWKHFLLWAVPITLLALGSIDRPFLQPVAVLVYLLGFPRMILAFSRGRSEDSLGIMAALLVGGLALALSVSVGEEPIET